MMLPNRFFTLLFILSYLNHGFSQVQKKIAVVEFNSFSELEKTWLAIDSSTKVINFWATWCRPCVKELPYFEFMAQKHSKDLKVYLVSLDKKQDLEKLKNFLSKREISTPVGVLLDKDSNSWIDQVCNEWTGSIPATVIIKNNKKYFFEKEFESYNDLYDSINSLN